MAPKVIAAWDPPSKSNKQLARIKTLELWDVILPLGTVQSLAQRQMGNIQLLPRKIALQNQLSHSSLPEWLAPSAKQQLGLPAPFSIANQRKQSDNDISLMDENI